MLSSIQSFVRHNMQLMPAGCSMLLAGMRQLHDTAGATPPQAGQPEQHFSQQATLPINQQYVSILGFAVLHRLAHMHSLQG
jgi:hypothetical protein